MSDAVITGLLAATGIYLLLHGDLVRLVIGFFLLQHAVNLLLITARAPQRTEAPIIPVEAPSDPLGQAFVLTAIVISFGTMVFVLTLMFQRGRPGRE